MLSQSFQQLTLHYGAAPVLDAKMSSSLVSFSAQCLCRQHIREQHIDKELVSLLPAIELELGDIPAGRALSGRM